MKWSMSLRARFKLARVSRWTSPNALFPTGHRLGLRFRVLCGILNLTSSNDRRTFPPLYLLSTYSTEHCKCGMFRLIRLRVSHPKCLQPRRRYTASAKFDPLVQGYVQHLAEHQPCFTAAAKNIRIMHEPHEYYQSLLVGVVP